MLKLTMLHESGHPVELTFAKPKGKRVDVTVTYPGRREPALTYLAEVDDFLQLARWLR